MARINIEDSLWKNPGFQDFMIICGSRKLAKAHVLEAFEAAQKHWFPDRKSVPERELVALDIPVEDLIKCRLAERRQDGIYIKGSEAQFSWLFKRSEAGKKSGDSRRKKKDEQVLNNDKQCSTPVETTEVNRTSSSISFSISSSSSNSSSFSEEIGSSGDDGPHPNDLLKLWNEHCGPLPKAQKLTNVRRQAAKARLREKPDLEYWQSIITTLANAPFTTGHNDRGWRANIDFLLRPDTHVKASEGAYQGSGRPNLKAIPMSRNQHIWDEIEEMEQSTEREVNG